MRHQRLKSVGVEGFTSIRSATLALNDVNVLVGARTARARATLSGHWAFLAGSWTVSLACTSDYPAAPVPF